jgi:superfamily II DNA/RNA helicase
MSRLADKIYLLPSFIRQLKIVLIESTRNSFPNLLWDTDSEKQNDQIDWNNMLSCASIINQSKKLEHLDTALRIAQHCLNSNSSTQNQRVAAIVILEGLTNKLAINLALKRQLVSADYLDHIPLPIRLENISRDIAHSLINEDSTLNYLNKFQKKVYDSYLGHEVISISAPTSAGKSYILERIILEELTNSDNKRCIVFLVPTRALISQVEQELGVLLSQNNYEEILITSIPQKPDDETNKQHKIFVFTQERLHWFRSELPLHTIDVIIIDEAHKIEDGSRGILLQQKIEDVVRDFPSVKIFFSSPFTSNPEIFLEGIPLTKTQVPIKTEFVSVNQTLIYVSQKRNKPLQWEINLHSNIESVRLGEIVLKNRPTTQRKRLVFTTFELADSGGGNLIYVNGAADAEKYAQILADVLPAEYSQISEELKDLADLVKKVVHDKYSLSTVLKKKIAFHYGNMPIIIRQEIERLFKQGDIHFIVCTSTLLEGVNLPAKSVFIRKPTRGSGKPLSDADFWNLAGRAGRWGKEFSGNIICIEPETWTKQPLVDRTKQKVKRALNHVLDRKDEFLLFIKAGTPREIAKNNLDLEYAFTYFYSRFLEGKLENNQEELKLFEVEFQKVRAQVSLPTEIILRNIGVSPIAQQNLYNFFENYSLDISDLIPVLPESKDSLDSYKSIVEIINRYLSGDPESLSIYQAILIINWMKGTPLPVLINRSYEYWSTRKPKSYSTIIRDVMKDIEEFARFKFAKYSSCYIDILRYFLTQKGRLDLFSEIPQLNIWLEFGVSQQTQISLIGLGLSRNSAIVISEFIANDKLNIKECLDWLKAHDPETWSISPIMINEIKRVTQKHIKLTSN